MKFCLDARTASPHFPGIGRYVNSLIQALPAELNESDSILFLYHPLYVSNAADHFSISRKFQTIPAPFSPFSLPQQWQIPRLLRQTSAELYHSPYYLMPFFSGIPTVLTVYDLIPLHFPHTVSPRARLFFLLATRLALRAAASVIAISDATRADYLRAFNLSTEKITGIPLAAGENFHPQSPTEVERVRVKYSLPAEFALYVGINKPHKNLPSLLEAWAQFLRQIAPQKASLVLAGAWDPRYPQTRHLAAELELEDSVYFLGPVADSDLPALYSAADIFIYPSTYEGFGLPVLEAMACGVPVACSRTSSLPEVAGQAALFFDPHDPESIADAILRLWSDESLRQELRTRGLIQSATFSWQRTARETAAVYWRTLTTLGC